MGGGGDVCCTLGIKCLLSEYLSVCSAGTISHRKVKVYKKKSVLLHLGLKSVMSMAWLGKTECCHYLQRYRRTI